MPDASTTASTLSPVRGMEYSSSMWPSIPASCPCRMRTVSAHASLSFCGRSNPCLAESRPSTALASSARNPLRPLE